MLERPSFRRDLRRLLGLTTVLALLLTLAAFLGSQDPRRSFQEPRHSVRRTDHAGTAAAFRLLRTVGVPVETWEQELDRLSGPGVLLHFSLPGEGEPLDHELVALDAWIRGGGTLILVASQSTVATRAFGVQLETKGDANRIVAAVSSPDQKTRLSRRVAKLDTGNGNGWDWKAAPPKGEDEEKTDVAPPIPRIPESDWVALYRTDVGKGASVVAATRDKGMVIAVNQPHPFTNAGLSDANNAQFLINLASLTPKGGRFWFDQRHQRQPDRGLVAYLRGRSLEGPLVYAVLFLGLVFWRTGSRLGPPLPPPLEPRPGSREYVTAMGQLFRSAGLAGDSLQTIRADVQRSLARRFRVDHGASLETLSEAMEKHLGGPEGSRLARECLEVFREAAEMERANRRDQREVLGAVRAALRLAKFEAAVRDAGRSGRPLAEPQRVESGMGDASSE